MSCTKPILSSAALCALLLSAPVSPQAPARSGYTLDPAGDLSAMIDCLEAQDKTLISAHRGGPSAGLPENGIETMDAIMAALPAIMEVDVARSSDGVHFLMHDRTLDRTTNGTGTASKQGWEEIRALNLVDRAGWQTPYRVPSLKDALEWAKERTILQLDFKRSASFEEVIALVRETKMEERVILIAYSVGQARRLHELAPEMLISFSINAERDLTEIVEEGVPADRIVAFTGTSTVRPDLYERLDAQDVEVIFGTLGRPDRSLDGIFKRFGTDERYVELSEGGVDILATDRPRDAAVALENAGRLPEAGQCGVQTPG